MGESENRTVALTARVPKPLMQEVEEIADQKQQSKSATTKELVQKGLEAEAQPEPKPVADGGAILRPILRTMTGIALSTGLLGFVVFYVGTVSFGLHLALLDILAFTLSMFVAGGLTFLPLMTEYPERADRRLWSFSSQIRTKVKA